MKDQLRAAAGAAPTLGRLNGVAQTVWRALGAGAIDEAEAGELSELVELRRAEIRARLGGERRPEPAPGARPRRAHRNPERVARRRRLAASGPMPPALAAAFTTSELAVLRIIGDECRQHGACEASLGEIAARAGVGRTSVQNAVRAARRAGLIAVEERRRSAWRNDPNRITIASPEWSTWLQRGPKGGRVQKHEPHGYGRLDPDGFSPEDVATRAERTGSRHSRASPEAPQPGPATNRDRRR